MRVLIVGCGYVGLPLGARLAGQGHEVFGLRRSESAAAEMQAAGIRPVAADITRAEDLAKLPEPLDWVVHCVASGGGSEPDYRALYLEGTRNLVGRLGSMALKKFVYTSSTSVYGQSDGSLVKENSPTEPASATSRVLVETENLLLAAARETKFPAVILRVAGIYGPDRGYPLKLFLKNEARIEGKGDRVMNMIHRDDLLGCIEAALRSGRPGEVYNAVDDEPVSQFTFYQWLAATLGKYPPPTVPEDPERRRGLTSKKVSNRRLKMELGYQFQYPNFRKGYSAELLRLDRAGQLDIPKEER